MNDAPSNASGKSVPLTPVSSPTSDSGVAAGFSPRFQPDPETGFSPGSLTEPTSADLELQPGDAYMEGPYLVFTEQYHLRRGYCCNSGCRHCPYR